MSKHLLGLDVATVARLYQKRALSPTDMAQAALAQIACLNPALNAFCHTDAKATLAAARAAEKRWRAGTPLSQIDGMTVSIKDWYDVKGWSTRMGSRLTAMTPAAKDSLPVTLLKRAGAVIVGKTTLPEFGHKGVTDSPLQGITRNPWNTTKTCGGSSGGAAVAAATGMAQLNLGSDAGGSIRIPASFCGVFGFKPSPGLVASWPPSLFATLSSAGTLTKYARDAAYMMDILKSPQGIDWNNTLHIEESFHKTVSPFKRKIRVAYIGEIENTRAEKNVEKEVLAALDICASFLKVTPVKTEFHGVTQCFNRHWMAIAARMGREYGKAERKKLDPRFLSWIERGEKLALQDYLDAQYQRMLIGQTFQKLFDDYDFIITPTTAMTAFDTGTNMPFDKSGKPVEDWTPFTYPANLARLPAASLPCGITASGMPVGLQVMAGYGRDIALMRMCLAVERAIGFEGLLPA